jgi:hypothetical protein
MAKDLLLKHLCPHYVVMEWLAIETDRQSLNTVRLPSASQVKIEVNGIEVPKAGLKAPVSIATRKSQPFTITRNVNDELRLTVNSGSLQTIFLPSGQNVTASLIVNAINEQAVGVVATSNFGQIRLTTDTAGQDATLYLRGGSSHETLGLVDTRFYRGKTIIPAWNLVRRPDTVDPLERFIQFESPVRAADDVWEVSYFTRRQECRRCASLGIENDIRFDSRGDPQFATGIDLLAQEVEKITITQKGSNVFYNWYGTSIVDLIGSKILRGGSLIEQQLVSEISGTLERLRNVKNQQAALQPVGDQEFFQRVQSLSVLQDDVDPTVFRIRIEIQNASGEVAELRQNLVLQGGPTRVA